jgi:predicted flap endonuclease-1-like 5' DNA nuclease
MSLLYDVVFASRCRSTHHRLAVDALRHLQSPDAELWANLLLHFNEEYLKGAKAPDDVFKDFKNHVLHVRDNNWGGAIEACEEWQRRTMRALQDKDWQQAAWSAGVMSHYFCDPLQPFHTGQTEEENVIHRAVEWSFNKSYKTFQQMLEAGPGYPDIECPQGSDWVAQMVLAGAQAANKHYELIIDHYDLEAGVKDPPSGLDDAIRQAVAPLIGHAAVGLARMLDRTFAQAAVRPPNVPATLQAMFLAMEMPIQSVLKQIDNDAARKEVAAQYDEYRRTGKVRQTLGEDDRVVRELHATEVLKTPISSLDARWPRELGSKTEAARLRPTAALPPAPPPKPLPAPKPPVLQTEALAPPPEIIPPPAKPKRTRKSAAARTPAADVAGEPQGIAPLEAAVDTPAPEPAGAGTEKAEKQKPAKTPGALDQTAPVVDAPSIGPKTARRLEALGVKTIADLLALSADEGETKLKARHISADVIRDWQSQALLACTVPGLRSREAQALVACGVRDAHELSIQTAPELCEAVAHWGLSDEGSRAWGSAPAPGEDDVAQWIERAKTAGRVEAKNAA